jgi:hypothetical protein
MSTIFAVLATATPVIDFEVPDRANTSFGATVEPYRNVQKNTIRRAVLVATTAAQDSETLSVVCVFMVARYYVVELWISRK